MDRCYALGGPCGYRLRGKKIAIALTYGDVDPFRSGAVNALRTFQDAFAYVEAEIAELCLMARAWSRERLPKIRPL